MHRLKSGTSVYITYIAQKQLRTKLVEITMIHPGFQIHENEVYKLTFSLGSRISVTLKN